MNLKHTTLALLAACVGLGASSLASACSISVTGSSPLERNEVTLSGNTLAKVAKRVIDAPYDFDGQWQVHVFGYALPNEANARALAEQRKEYAVRVLKRCTQDIAGAFHDVGK